MLITSTRLLSLATQIDAIRFDLTRLLRNQESVITTSTTGIELYNSSTGIEEDDGFQAGVLGVIHLDIPQRLDDLVHDSDADVVYFNFCRSIMID